MRPQSRSPHEIAARQWGNVTRSQLLTVCGLSRDQVKRWLAGDRLHREFRGVYRLGHRAPSIEARCMAAVLACGDGAVLSGKAAAHLYGLLPGGPPMPEVSTTADRRVPGVIVHRVRRTEATRWRGIPITTIGRTLADLAPRLGFDDLAAACHEADVRHGLDPGAVAIRNYKLILEGDHPTVLSKLESLFLCAVDTRAIPRPQTNRKQGAHYVDCRWPGLTVELDSYRFHRTRQAWERDHERRRAARRRGDEFRRYTWADVTEHTTEMLDEIEGLLAELDD